MQERLLEVSARTAVDIAIIMFTPKKVDNSFILSNLI